MNLKKILDEVCDIAERVGRFQAEQRKTFSRESVESKHSHDYVSYVDKESEQMIVPALRALLPEAGFITEEATTEQNDGGSELVWIVDPLDGTTNFIHDIGPWAVCIALVRNQQSSPLTSTETGGGLNRTKKPLTPQLSNPEYLLGVVYEVARKEMFFAAKGHGAWMRTADGEVKPLRPSQTADMDQALVVVGYPYNADGFRDFCTKLSARLYGHCASLRSFGSAEVELCYVAAGRIDVYFESFIKPWDVAAGAAIIQEPGARISDYDGADRDWPSGRKVLATNGLLHGAMVKEIAGAISC